MEVVNNIHSKIRMLSNGIGYITLLFMMVFLVYAAVSRSFFKPVMGDIEITSLTMVVAIMCGLIYAQVQDAHIKIGLFVDRLPKFIQMTVDILASLLTLSVTLVIAYVFYHVSMKFLGYPKYTEILKISYTPFKFLILITFVLWALEALFQLIKDIQNIFLLNK